MENKTFKIAKPYVIAGPCGIETEEQTFSTIRALKGMPINAIRGGIWKPRSRPGSFEGSGQEGLRWLKEAAAEIKLPVMVEVANTKHVEKSLKAGIEMLWIGARTTVNPFMVQELAEALKGTTVPILIKNPVNPDLSLWIGAIERIAASGNRDIAAIHRGFSALSSSIYRNQPTWTIPIELRRLIPDIPIICDPSHICGKRDLIPLVSQKAMDLSFDGLMIETHFKPDEALSDASQQLTPQQLGELLRSLTVRKKKLNNEVFNSRLTGLRNQIDTMDEQILDVFWARLKLVQEIGLVKRQNNIAIYQSERWDEIVNSRLNYAEKLGLEEDFVFKLMQMIHQESIEKQTKVFEEIRSKINLAQNGD